MADEFKRQDSHKKKQNPDSWRSPDGNHSRVRLERKGAAPKPKPGYRKPKAIRGKHPLGLDEVMVHNTDDLKDIDSENEAARIGSTVGEKKREDIIEKADEKDIHVLNRGEGDEK